MDYTYETKGAQRVAINQLGPALSKRQCTAQVCFRPEPPAPPPPASASDEVKRRYSENLLEQPPPCIIFRGTGKGISQYERDAYGFKIASAERTSAEQLAFSKEEDWRRRQVMRWLANQFFTMGRWWAGVWDKSWSATRMGTRSRRLTVDGERVKVNSKLAHLLRDRPADCEDSFAPG